MFESSKYKWFSSQEDVFNVKRERDLNWERVREREGGGEYIHWAETEIY